MSPPVVSDNTAASNVVQPALQHPPNKPLSDSSSNNVRLMRPQDFVCKDTSSDEDNVLHTQVDEPSCTEATAADCSDLGVINSTNNDHILFSDRTGLFSTDYFIEHIFSISSSSADLSDFRRRINLLFPHKICCSVLSFLLNFAQTSVFSSNHQCFLKQVFM